MKVHRINKEGTKEPMTGILYPSEASFEEVIEFIGKEDLREFIKLIDVHVNTWIIITYDDSLVIVSEPQFEYDGFSIDTESRYWEIYEITPIDGNDAKLILRGSIQENDLARPGWGELYSIIATQDWFRNSSAYLYRRSDGYVTTTNADGVYV